jgi:hypothetical protein
MLTTFPESMVTDLDRDRYSRMASAGAQRGNGSVRAPVHQDHSARLCEDSLTAHSVCGRERLTGCDGMIPPETQYAHAPDGTPIAYQVTGGGDVDLVFMQGAVAHLDLQWEDPRLTRLFERLSAFSRLIRFDRRGMGMSGVLERLPTFEEQVEDFGTVITLWDRIARLCSAPSTQVRSRWLSQPRTRADTGGGRFRNSSQVDPIRHG